MKTYGNLVRLLDLDPDFILALVYATPDNFTGKVIYTSSDCYIDADTGRRLVEAKNLARRDGYRMKVWDAYRPVRAQRRFWEILPDNDFVAYPPEMSPTQGFRNSHMNGQCVDVTLTDRNGQDLLMPSGFDDFSQKARLDCPLTCGEARRNGEYLRAIMVAAGFTPYAEEWWHFVNRNVAPAPYSDFVFPSSDET